jgi:hypothetical protein
VLDDTAVVEDARMLATRILLDACTNRVGVCGWKMYLKLRSC